MAELTIVASLVAKEGCEKMMEDELLKMIVPTRGENGCIEYRLHRDNENPARFLFYETWADQSSFENHLQTDHYAAYAAAVKGLTADKTVCRLTLIS